MHFQKHRGTPTTLLCGHAQAQELRVSRFPTYGENENIFSVGCGKVLLFGLLLDQNVYGQRICCIPLHSTCNLRHKVTRKLMIEYIKIIVNNIFHTGNRPHSKTDGCSFFAYARVIPPVHKQTCTLKSASAL